MDSKTIVSVLLGFLAVGSCQPPQPPLYESLDADSLAPEGPQDKQIAAFALGLLAPTVFTLATTGLYNLGSAVINAFSSTMAGKQLELIPIESVLATPIKETSSPAALSAPSAPSAPSAFGAFAALTAPAGKSSKRRPYIRSMVPQDNETLQDSQSKTSESS